METKRKDAVKPTGVLYSASLSFLVVGIPVMKRVIYRLGSMGYSSRERQTALEESNVRLSMLPCALKLR